LPEKLTDTIFWGAVSEVITYDDNKAKLFERLSQWEWKKALQKIVELARSNKIETAGDFKKLAEWNIEEIKKFFPGTSHVDLKTIADGYAAALPKTKPEGMTDEGNKLYNSLVDFSRFPTWGKLLGLIKNIGKSSADDTETLNLVNLHEQLLEKFFTLPADQTKLLEYHKKAKEICQLVRASGVKLPKTAEKNLLLLEQFANAADPTWAKLLPFAQSSFGKCKEENFPGLMGFHTGLWDRIFTEMSLRLLNSRALLDDVKEMIEFLFDRAAEVIRGFQHYKDLFGLMDFNDQETKALELISEQSFRQDIAERASLLMVDEFQDTNPIQLALMNGIHQAIHRAPEDRDETVWVGDPKQSIYSFRGADTTLMIETAKSVEQQTTLDNSHRSKKELVELSNRVFTRVFSTHDKNTVRLGVKREDPDGGKITSWLLNAGNKGDETKALAAGIAKLIKQGTKGSDIAVLCRSGDDCKAVAEALEERNIPSTYASRKLLETIECQLVLAAYQYALNDDNLLAATRYAVLSGEKNIADLFDSLLEKRQELGKKEQEAFRSILLDGSSLKRLESIANRVIDLTPGELLERVIQMLDIDQIIDRFQVPEARRCNLDALRKAANDYLQLASVGGLSPSPAGFLTWIQEAKLDAATAAGDDLVHVMTYHKAKGLEWPIVILYSLDSSLDLGKRVFDNVRALSADRFRPEDPLRGRLIHYWPYPFGIAYGKLIPVKKLNDQLEAAVSEGTRETLVKKLDELDTIDAKNRFYVGVTRARDHVIFAMRAKFGERENTIYNQWINDVNPDVFNWPTVEGTTAKEESWLVQPEDETTWKRVANNLTLETKIFSADDNIDTAVTPKPIFLDPLPEQKEFLPAKLNPSEAEEDIGTATLVPDYQMSEELKGKINAVRGDDDAAARFGNAFHQYIELHPQKDEEQIAKEYLEAWGCLSDDNTADVLVNQTKALYDWVNKKWPNGQVLREVPITLKNSEDQRFQGFIDMLIETDGGYAIIDHKTHSKEK
ncbi:MAG: UvrD-helicase domain-containing protein, partial [Thermoguttaceae bacterium]|nr:UvrD-helicase domain-containing protein [Thermoguttaceae bacterium]